VWPHDVESFQGSTFCLLWCSACYGTAVGHRSLLNRSGICDRIVCCNIFFVHTAVLSIKTVFNLVKIHLLLCIILLIRWSVIFCRPCCYRFRRLKYTPSVFRIYADIHDWRTNENLCNKLNPYPLTNLAATGNSCFRLVDF
jgi:hypothetical protein